MEDFIVKEAKEILKTDVKVLSRLLGGMSNYTYVIEADGKKYTFRQPGENAFHFVDRDVELKNIRLVEPLGITNHTIYLNLETGIKIANYVEGTVLSTLKRQDHLKAVSDTLKVLHKSNLKAENDYDPIGRLIKYETLNPVQLDKYYELKSIWLKLYEKYKNDKLVLCHGDAQPSNFVIIEQGAMVVDFEFTGNNDPYYDIACFGNIDFEDAIALLDVYIGHKAKPEESRKMIFYRLFQTLQWHQVATYKHTIGLSEKLHIPFDVVAVKYLEKAEALYKMYQEV